MIEELGSGCLEAFLQIFFEVGISGLFGNARTRTARWLKRLSWTCLGSSVISFVILACGAGSPDILIMGVVLFVVGLGFTTATAIAIGLDEAARSKPIHDPEPLAKPIPSEHDLA